MQNKQHMKNNDNKYRKAYQKKKQTIKIKSVSRRPDIVIVNKEFASKY